MCVDGPQRVTSRSQTPSILYVHRS